MKVEPFLACNIQPVLRLKVELEIKVELPIELLPLIGSTYTEVPNETPVP